jgi:hypothetical protein
LKIVYKVIYAWDATSKDRWSWYPQKTNGRMFRRKKACAKPRGRWEEVIMKDAVDLLQIRNWKATAKKRKCWRKEFEEAMDRKWAGVP